MYKYVVKDIYIVAEIVTVVELECELGLISKFPIDLFKSWPLSDHLMPTKGQVLYSPQNLNEEKYHSEVKLVKEFFLAPDDLNIKKFSLKNLIFMSQTDSETKRKPNNEFIFSMPDVPRESCPTIDPVIELLNYVIDQYKINDRLCRDLTSILNPDNTCEDESCNCPRMVRSISGVPDEISSFITSLMAEAKTEIESFENIRKSNSNLRNLIFDFRRNLWEEIIYIIETGDSEFDHNTEALQGLLARFIEIESAYDLIKINKKTFSTFRNFKGAGVKIGWFNSYCICESFDQLSEANNLIKTIESNIESISSHVEMFKNYDDCTNIFNELNDHFNEYINFREQVLSGQRPWLLKSRSEVEERFWVKYKHLLVS